MFFNFSQYTSFTRRFIFAVAVFGAGSTIGYACPMVEGTGDEIVYTADELWSGASFYVTAGGDVDISQCPIENGNGVGFVTQAPDFELSLSETKGYSLRMRVEADCDAVLLVNTGNGNWFYNDDGGGDGNPEINLTRPSEGVYDIWVGTFNSENCPANLILETNGSPTA